MTLYGYLVTLIIFTISVQAIILQLQENQINDMLDKNQE
jgi:hypothetical protein